MTDSLFNILSRGVVDAEARGKKRKRKKKNRKGNNDEAIQQQIQARCVSQIPACEALASDSCDNAACAAAVRGCCQSLTTCEFGAFFTCVNEVFLAGA